MQLDQRSASGNKNEDGVGFSALGWKNGTDLVHPQETRRLKHDVLPPSVFAHANPHSVLPPTRAHHLAQRTSVFLSAPAHSWS
jgi:hypothetical protein